MTDKDRIESIANHSDNPLEEFLETEFWNFDHDHKCHGMQRDSFKRSMRKCAACGCHIGSFGWAEQEVLE